MNKFLKILGGGLAVLGWLGSMTGIGYTKAMPVQKKEPVKQQVDPSSPVYLQHNVSDYALTVEGKDSSSSKMTQLHWNHWSHCNHHSHWNSW